MAVTQPTWFRAMIGTTSPGATPAAANSAAEPLHGRGQAGVGQLHALMIGERHRLRADRGPPLQDMDQG